MYSNLSLCTYLQPNFHQFDSSEISRRSITDLSECQLTQIPDAIFLLMKNTSLQSCNLAGNLITKIPTKLATSFSLITGQQIYRTW